MYQFIQQPCTCGGPARWLANAAHYRIRRDEVTGEFEQTSRTGVRWFLKYCFECGGKLNCGPIVEVWEGDRDSPELLRMHELRAQSTTLLELVGLVGAPDFEWLYKPVRHVQFWKIFPTAVLCVDELRDGRLLWRLMRKPD